MILEPALAVSDAVSASALSRKAWAILRVLERHLSAACAATRLNNPSRPAANAPK